LLYYAWVRLSSLTAVVLGYRVLSFPFAKLTVLPALSLSQSRRPTSNCAALWLALD